MEQFDYNDEFDPKMKKAVLKFKEENTRWPNLFGPNADNLLTTPYAAETQN
jgi:hypothetical protein